MKKRKIKYGVITTVESNMRSFCLPLVERLAKEGFEPVMMCGMSQSFVDTYSSEYKCIQIGIKRGFHVINLLKTIFELKTVFKKEQFDIVQYGTENAAFCASIAAWMAKVPIRIYEHWGARYVGYVGVMRFISKIIEKSAAFFSTDVRQVSHLNMEMCIKDGIYSHKKVKVLGKGGTVGVDFSKFDLSKRTEYSQQIRMQYGIADSSFIFGFVGRIQKDKGVNELLDSFKNIYEKDENSYLMLVGNIDSENPLEPEKIEWAKECSNVIFTGRVTDVYRYMSAFDTMVHPTYREGFGMVLQEAAAIKTPIITTDIMGPGEFINNGVTGKLVKPKDSETLYKAMLEMKDDAEKRNLFAENNYKFTLDNFERTVMVSRIVEDRIALLKNKKII